MKPNYQLDKKQRELEKKKKKAEKAQRKIASAEVASSEPLSPSDQTAPKETDAPDVNE
jgi:hypothetical protein